MSNNTVIHDRRKIPKTTKVSENKAVSNCVETSGLAKIQGHLSWKVSTGGTPRSSPGGRPSSRLLFAQNFPLLSCPDQTIAKCCSKQASLESWEYLKKRLKELKLDEPQDSRPSCIFRIKANCLRVCCSRPIMVVYPDGVWYRQVKKGSN